MPSNRKIASLMGLIVSIIFIIIIIQDILGIASMDDRAKKIGYRPVIVVTGSMEPAIEVNSISIMEYCSIEDIEIGDILMFLDPYKNINITHRVVNIEKDGEGRPIYLNTKGDANESIDDINITSELVVGRITKTYNWAAPYLSKVMLEPGEINSAAIVQLFLGITVAMALVVIVGYNIIIMVMSLIIASRGQRYFEVYLTELEESIGEIERNMEELRDIAKCGGNKNRLAKARAIREIKLFKETTKDFNRAMKIIRCFCRKD